MEYSLQHTIGTTNVLPIRVTHSNGDIVDLTGTTIELTVSTNKQPGTEIFTVTVTNHTDPTNGLSEVRVLPTLTDLLAIKLYYFTIKLIIIEDVEEYVIAKGQYELTWSNTSL